MKWLQLTTQRQFLRPWVALWSDQQFGLQRFGLLSKPSTQDLYNMIYGVLGFGASSGPMAGKRDSTVGNAVVFFAR